MVFHADGGANGRELWISDGTTDGTKLVRGFAGLDSVPRNLTAFAGRLLFTTGETAAPELWATDSTAEGTFPLQQRPGEPVPGSCGRAPPTDP